MNELLDHKIYCPEGFYDMQRYPERIEHGKQLLVTRSQYRQMKNSDPSVELLRIQPPDDILKRIVTQARVEKAERDEDGALTVAEVAEAIQDKEVLVREATAEEEAAEAAMSDQVDDPPVEGWDEDIDWKPIPWYAAQLAKGEKDD